MNNSIAQNHSLFSLLGFAFPNMLMMLVLSLYTIVDGTFVSRYVGTTALSAVNMVYPTSSVQMAVAIMIATGGNAIMARQMGENKYDKARENFSFLILTELAIGILIAVFGNLFIDNIVFALGATEQQFNLCKTYAGILFKFAPCFFLQTAFQTFFVTAGKPTVGLTVTIISGVINIFLDYVFIVPLQMGIAGAAIATGIGYSFAAVVGLFYFTFVRKNHLHFVKPKAEQKLLRRTCANGSSEMVTNLANAVTTFLFNYMILKFYGEDGVAAITIILYLQYVFTALIFGFSNGIAPIISFKYGEQNETQLKKLFQYGIVIVLFCSAIMFGISQLFIGNVLTVFTTAESNVYQIALYGFRIYAIAFLFAGFNIFASAWFTALSNGKISAIISLTRTFLFLAGAIVLLPIVLKALGVWLAVPCAEILGILVSIYCLRKYKSQYHY